MDGIDAVVRDLDRVDSSIVTADMSFASDILTYGVEAVLHHEVFRRIIKSKNRLATIKRLGVKKTKDTGDKGIGMNIKRLPTMGVYVPKHCHNLCDSAEDTIFFAWDYRNRFYGLEASCEINNAELLINSHRELSPEDLAYETMLVRGIRFSKYMWTICQRSYNENRHNPALEEIGSRLMQYYGSIINR